MNAPVNHKPVVGLMLGDVTGIGAEIATKMLAHENVQALARTVLIGDARHLALGCREAGVELPTYTVASIDAIDWSERGFPLIDLGNLDPAKFPRAELSADADFLTDRGNLAALVISAGAAKPPQSVTTVVGALKVHIPLSGLVDLSKVKTQLEKRAQTLAKSIAGKEGRLGNADYVARAPAEQVAETKQMLESERTELANVKETLATL